MRALCWMGKRDVRVERAERKLKQRPAQPLDDSERQKVGV